VTSRILKFLGTDILFADLSDFYILFTYFMKVKMIKCFLLTAFVFILLLCQNSYAVHEGELYGTRGADRGIFGLNDRLAETGLQAGLSITNIYQQNVKGG